MESMKKGKSVLIDDDVHNKIKHIVIDENTTIEEKVNSILRKELGIKEKEVKT